MGVRSPPAPPSHSVICDLRRGVLRSLPFAALFSLVLFSNPPHGAAVLTFNLVWIPLALLGGWAQRRSLTFPRLLVVAALAWVIAAGMYGGAVVQFHYLKGLWGGMDPGRALGAVDVGPLSEMLALSGCLCIVLVLHTLFVAEQSAAHDPREDRVGYALTIQIAILAALFAAHAESKETLRVFFGFALVGFIAVGGVGGVLWLMTSALDRLEARLWPASEGP